MRVNTTNYPQKQAVKEINLKELYRVIKERLWIVLLITLLATAAGVMKNIFFTTSLYETSTRILIEADAEYRNTLQVIIEEPIVLEKVIRTLDIATTPEALAGQITVASMNNSQVVSISVFDTDPVQASKIANTTAEVFKEQLPNITQFDKVDILSKAKVNPYPINEDQSRTIIIAFVLGLIFGIGLALLLDSLDDSIKSEDDVEELLGLPVVGAVSKMTKRNIRKINHSQREIE